MATIKSYTDIEQSQKLAEILPLESADMCYKCIYEDPYDICLRPYSEWKEEYKGLLVNREVDVIPCWSLAALLGVLPFIDFTMPQLIGTPKTLYVCMYNDDLRSYPYDNPIDAVYGMIIKLYEQNLI